MLAIENTRRLSGERKQRQESIERLKNIANPKQEKKVNNKMKNIVKM